MNAVFLAWIVEVGFIGVRELSSNHRLPLPSQLIASALVFGGLSIAAESETFSTPAAALAWGLVLGTLVGAKSDKPALLHTTAAFLAPASTNTPQTGGTAGLQSRATLPQ